MSHFLLSYHSGIIGYGLSGDLDEAMEEAEDRCWHMQEEARIVERGSLRVVATVTLTSTGYRAVKEPS